MQDKSLRIEKQTINKELDVMYNVTNEVVSAKASYAEFEKLLCQPVPPNVAFYAYITGLFYIILRNSQIQQEQTYFVPLLLFFAIIT